MPCIALLKKKQVNVILIALHLHCSQASNMVVGLIPRGVLRISSDRDDRMGAKIKIQKYP